MASLWKRKKCSCGDEIVFLPTGWMPVSVIPAEGSEFRAPTHQEIKYLKGQHEPHWAVCKDAEKHKTDKK